MMYAKSLSHGKKRPLLAIGEQHLRPLHVARRLGPRPRKSRQCFNLLSGHRQVDRSPLLGLAAAFSPPSGAKPPPLVEAAQPYSKRRPRP
jgi:hypothetical protein